MSHTITLPPELLARVHALKVDAQRFCESAIDRALREIEMNAKSAPPKGRPAPPVPKSKRSLYLDAQVWQALENLSAKNQDEGISSAANRLLRVALCLDE